MDLVSDGRVNNKMPIWAVWFSFSGRINRETFWLKGVLLPLCVVIGLILVSYAATGFSEVAGVILWYLALGTYVIISIAVVAKRLHDCNRTAWWVLTIFIPFVGLIIAIFGYIALGILKGDTEPNRYGDVP